MGGKKAKLPRKSVLKININSESEQKVLLDYANGILNIYDKRGEKLTPENITFLRLRERVNGKKQKIISKIENVNSMSLNIGRYIDTFDEIFAVDTNTKKIKGQYYSKGILAKLVKVKDDSSSFEIEISRIISSENNTFKPEMEQAVWNRAISELQVMIPEDKKIALIVNCDLENIEMYNTRKMKIRNDKFLPENFILIYASADISDSIFNKMIRFCDKEATRLLEEIEKEEA